MSTHDKPDSPDEARRLYKEVLESVGEGAHADEEAIGVVDLFRIANKLDVSIVETPHDWVFSYSIRDVERLGRVERDDWQKIKSEWRTWHREYAGFSLSGLVGWIFSAVVTWFLLYRGDRVLEIATTYGVNLPTWIVTAIGCFLLGGVLLLAPRLLATLTYSAHWDTYSAGYEEGLRQGINRALMITPEREREMWDEISKADLAQSHLEYAAEKAASKAD